MYSIGSVTLPNQLILAPMAGVTDLAFRQICREHGAGLTVTEMASAKALEYGDKKTPRLLRLGLKGMIGKGERSDEVRKSIEENHAVYFAAIGGAGALYGNAIKKSELIAFPDLLSEAVYRFEIEDFPCIVAIDCHGGNIYKR